MVSSFWLPSLVGFVCIPVANGSGVRVPRDVTVAVVRAAVHAALSGPAGLPMPAVPALLSRVPLSAPSSSRMALANGGMSAAHLSTTRARVDVVKGVTPSSNVTTPTSAPKKKMRPLQTAICDRSNKCTDVK